MPKLTGMELLERIVAVDPGTDVILITSHYSPESAVEAIQKGACDYWTKPLDVEKLRSRIAGFIAEAEKRQKTLRLDRELVDACQFEGMVGRSPLMLEVFARIRRVAPHLERCWLPGRPVPVRNWSPTRFTISARRVGGKFAVCNCSALVETLLESELFGHVRGSFTGATQDKPGLFEYADGGTIFLDEIGELSLRASQIAARVAEPSSAKSRIPLTRSIDVRVIAATHRDLKAMVRKKAVSRRSLLPAGHGGDLAAHSSKSARGFAPAAESTFIEKFATDYNKSIAGITRTDTDSHGGLSLAGQHP